MRVRLPSALRNADQLRLAADVMSTGWHAAVSAGVGPGMTVAVASDGAVGLSGRAAGYGVSVQRHRCETRQRGKQAVLELSVANCRVRTAASLVEPVPAAAARLRLVTGGQPFLGQVAEPEVVGSTGPTHPGGHPAGVDGVAEHIRPKAGDSEGEGDTSGDTL